MLARSKKRPDTGPEDFTPQGQADMGPEKEERQFVLDFLRNAVDKAMPILEKSFSFFRLDPDKTREQVRDIFHATSDQVREKAEETRRAVKLRMAALEIEHHLNRLYPQIGKMICDMAEEGKKTFHNNPEIKEKLELAEEYRNRLAELRAEQRANRETDSDEG